MSTRDLTDIGIDRAAIPKIAAEAASMTSGQGPDFRQTTTLKEQMRPGYTLRVSEVVARAMIASSSVGMTSMSTLECAESMWFAPSSFAATSR